MALGDSIPSSRIHHSDSSSSTVTASVPDDDRRDSELAAPASTSYGGNGSSTAADSAGVGATSMAYLSQTVVLCELRHDAFEASVPIGPCQSGLVSRWRPKDRSTTTA
ncbi:unnamed protein product [Lupinus luteus]|uniref:Uncharacterized protein n=1 Tax=Lupinus luteus TaxID=3873 RepID=A0AAV1Y3G0_LUPLU